MADVENQQESSFPVKRKSDLYCQDQDSVANKANKLNPSCSSADYESKDGEFNGSGVENLNSSSEEKIGTESSILPEKTADSESKRDENGVDGDLGGEDEQEGGDVEGFEEEEEEEEEEEDYSIDAEIERKGNCISREDKGKGKMIEVDDSEDEDDSDDEDDEDGGDEYDESDLSDDPLAEVDLDNILPSRTRRRSIQPAVYISNETSDRGGNDEDDDSSDDSDD